MSEPGWAEVLAEHHVEESAVERSARLARQAAEAQDRADAQAEAERAAAVEDERDRRLFQYQQLGIGGRSVDDLAADASRAAAEDDAYTSALETIAKIDRRRASRAQAQRFQAEQLESVSRSQDQADPLAAAQRRAHEAFCTETRAQMNEAVSGQPVSRPKDVVRSRGDAARANEPTTCKNCQDLGITDRESERRVHREMDAQKVKRNHIKGLQPYEVPAQRREGESHGPMIFR